MDHGRRAAFGITQRVCVMQALGSLHEHARGQRERVRAAWHRSAQLLPRHAVEIFHRKKQRAVVLVELERLAHVWMREVRGDPALVEEQLLELRVLREVRQDALDRDELRKPARTVQAPQEQLRHAAAPELDQQLVAADALLARLPHGPSLAQDLDARARCEEEPYRTSPLRALDQTRP